MLFSGISLSLGYKYLPLLKSLSKLYYLRFVAQLSFIALPYCLCQQYYYQATRRQLDTLQRKYLPAYLAYRYAGDVRQLNPMLKTVY